jgi:hypothetical protein
MKPFYVAVALAAALCSAVPATTAVLAQSDDDLHESLAGGAWHPGTFVACADGVVTAVHSRLEEPNAGGKPSFGSGVVVEMALPTAPKFFNGYAFRQAVVVHYDHEPSNALMQSETPGTRVQVCLAGFPTPSHDPDTGKVICDPNGDPRGFVFRVYDYRRHAAFMGPDSQHSCGGA